MTSLRAMCNRACLWMQRTGGGVRRRANSSRRRRRQRGSYLGRYGTTCRRRPTCKRAPPIACRPPSTASSCRSSGERSTTTSTRRTSSSAERRSVVCSSTPVCHDLHHVLTTVLRNESAPIRLARCRLHGLSVSNAKILLIYFSNKIFLKQFYQTALGNCYGLKLAKG